MTITGCNLDDKMSGETEESGALVGGGGGLLLFGDPGCSGCPGTVVELEGDDTDATSKRGAGSGPGVGVVCPIWRSTKRSAGSLEGVCERRCLWTIETSSTSLLMMKSSVIGERGLLTSSPCLWSESSFSISILPLLLLGTATASALGTFPGWTTSDAVDVSAFVCVSLCVTMGSVEAMARNCCRFLFQNVPD